MLRYTGRDMFFHPVHQSSLCFSHIVLFARTLKLVYNQAVILHWDAVLVNMGEDWLRGENYPWLNGIEALTCQYL